MTVPCTSAKRAYFSAGMSLSKRSAKLGLGYAEAAIMGPMFGMNSMNVSGGMEEVCGNA